jgi:hypothetical protein
MIKAMVSPRHCQQRHRPLRPGASIGHHLNSAGTLTCFVRERDSPSGPLFALSNNHVLCYGNGPHSDDSIIQPGKADKGKHPKDRIGELHRFVRLYRDQVNFVDGAISTVDNSIATNSDLLCHNRVVTVIRDDISAMFPGNETVYKIGRTTGHRPGSIQDAYLDLVVQYPGLGEFRFDNVLRIECLSGSPFSQGGDSGSLVFDDSGAAIGMVFAGETVGKRASYVLPIRPTLDALNADLA